MPLHFRLAPLVLLAALVAAQAPVAEPPDATARELLAAHDRERAAEKLPPLEFDGTLAKVAKLHARDMAERREMTHEGADGSRVGDRVKRAGYHYVRVGENVARGQRSVRRVMKEWMRSEGHRKNILGDFTRMGGALVKDEDGDPYWCVVFATPWVRLDPDAAERDVADRIAAARSKAEKVALEPDPRLASAARALAAETAEQAGEPEERRRKPDLAALLKKSGARYRDVAVLVGRGEPTAEEFVASLLKDETRAATLLDDFDAVGIGYATDAEDAPVWCVVLSRR